MSTESWKGLFPFNKNEETIRVFESIKLAPEAKIRLQEERTLVFTNQRLIFIRKKFSGLVRKKFEGYEPNIDERHLNSIKNISVSTQVKNAVRVSTSFERLNLGILFSSRADLDQFLTDINNYVKVDDERHSPTLITSKIGRNGIINVYSNYVEIDRTSSRFFGGLSGLHGVKRIYFDNIGSVNFKKSGLAVGWIQFSILGGRDTSGIFETMENENTVTFFGNNNQWEMFCNHIQKLIEDFKYSRNTKSQSRINNNAVSYEDPLQILKIRLAKGEITKEEYEEMKDLFK